MTQVCAVCSSKHRKAIDREIVAGGNMSELARKYKISYDSIWRHKRDHLSAALARGAEVAAQNHGVKLLEDLDELVLISRRILRTAEEDGHRGTALKAVKEARSSIVAIAQITHAMWQQQQQEITIIEAQEARSNPLDEQFQTNYKKLPKHEQELYHKISLKCLSAVDHKEPTVLVDVLGPGKWVPSSDSDPSVIRTMRRKKPLDT